MQNKFFYRVTWKWTLIVGYSNILSLTLSLVKPDIFWFFKIPRGKPEKALVEQAVPHSSEIISL
jgi:hypothetical protein